MRTSHEYGKSLAKVLDEKEGTMIFKMFDKMLTSQKFKDFFNKNVASL
jgi:hypothetical protein